MGPPTRVICLIVLGEGLGLRDNRTLLRLNRQSATSVAARAEIEVACACADIKRCDSIRHRAEIDFHAGVRRAGHAEALDEGPI